MPSVPGDLPVFRDLTANTISSSVISELNISSSISISGSSISISSNASCSSGFANRFSKWISHSILVMLFDSFDLHLFVKVLSFVQNDFESFILDISSSSLLASYVFRFSTVIF